MTRYFDDKEYASGDIGHFVDTIPTIVFNALAAQTSAPQYLIKLSGGGQNIAPQFTLIIFNEQQDEFHHEFDNSANLIDFLKGQEPNPNSKILFNSGIHYEPVIL